MTRCKFVLCFLLLSGFVFAKESVLVSPAKEIPIVYKVDVLVLGGSCGAVAAAEEASKAGAKTMLVTQFPYLGEDVTATLRLWHNIGKEHSDPLVKAIYNDPNRNSAAATDLGFLLKHNKRVPFDYKVEQKISSNHGESSKKDRLSDGIAVTPNSDSLQIDGKATIILDLKKPQDVGVLSLISFYREGGFAVDGVEFFAGETADSWKSLGTVSNKGKLRPAEDNPEVFALQLPKKQKMRYVKIETVDVPTSRILLGEIVLLNDSIDVTAEAKKVADQLNASSFHAPRPMHVKRILDKTLLDAGVSFLYNAPCTGLLKNDSGKIQGAIITTRNGRASIFAKTVVDARYDAAQPLASVKGDVAKVEYVVIGRESVPFEKGNFTLLQNATCENMGVPFHAATKDTGPAIYSMYKYIFDLKKSDAEKAFKDDIFAKAKLETEIRLATYHPDEQFAADRFILSEEKAINLGNKFAVDGIAAGRGFGQEAAAESKKFGEIDAKKLKIVLVGAETQKDAASVKGVVSELLHGVRQYVPSLGAINTGEEAYPIIGEFDVVIIGGGTTGAPAGIAAARKGAKTLVVESQHDLGGVGTLGAISSYYWGNIVGFCKEILGGTKNWNPVHKAYVWRKLLNDAGGVAIYGTIGAGAVVEGEKVKGVLLSTPYGPKIVLSKVVIDATGNADIAAAAGALTINNTENEIAVQGAGLSPRNLGAKYNNNDFAFIEDSDPIDVTHVFVYAKDKYVTAFDQAKIVNTRERRRIVGDFVFTALDEMNARTYPDSIARAFSNYDSHGYTVDPIFEVKHPLKAGYFGYYPYRSSLPKGLDGILVGGLATSCHRDAVPIIRMQSDLQNQGYGLGWAAATSVADGVSLRNVDIRKVQKHLVEIGNLDESVLTEEDNYESSKAGLAAAVKTIPNDFDGAALVMWHPKESLPMLKKAFSEASEFEAKLAYAKVLAAMGDATGEKVLLEKLQKYSEWDKGWNFRGMGQFGPSASEMDQFIMMLGRIKSKSAVPLIVEKLNDLTAESEFSHHRACFLALEWIGDKSAAAALAAHLCKAEMSGYIHDSIETAKTRDKEDPKGVLGERARQKSLIEIGAARALYRLGDENSLGRRILEAYSKDMRGHFARHAAEILASK